MKSYLLGFALLGLLATPALAEEGKCKDKQEKRGEAEAKEGRGKGKRAKHRRNPIKAMDTDADGKISKDEARGRSAENFDEIDTDDDGFLTEAELKAFHEAKKAEKENE